MGALTSLATAGLNLAMAERARDRENEQLERSRDRRIADIRADAAQADRASQQLLRERLARARARAGASGIGGTGGSIDAVLAGLEQESRAASAERARDAAVNIRSVRDTYARRRRRNLLDLGDDWLNAGSELLGGSRGSLLD